MAGQAGVVPWWRGLKMLVVVAFAGAVIVGAADAMSASSSSGQSVSVNGHRLLSETARSEACVHLATGRYTANLDDLNLLAANSIVIDQSWNHLALEVSAGSGGQSFFARASRSGFDDYLQVSADVVDQGSGPSVPLHCPFSKATVERSLKLGISTQKGP